METVAETPANYGQVDAGSAENPYLISNLANLRWLSETPEAWGTSDRGFYFLQTVDIDALESKYWHEGRGFLPIGLTRVDEDGIFKEILFFGNYDGNNFAIKNVYINLPYEEKQPKAVGLFSAINNSTLANIRIVDINLVTNDMTGALVGVVKDSSIKNSSATGDININKNARAVGGLIGITHSSSISSSSSSMVIHGNNLVVDESRFTGGLVGMMRESTLSNSYFNGSIESQTRLIGGLVGGVHDTIVENCYVSTRGALPQGVKDQMWVGAITCAICFDSRLISTFYNSETTGTKIGVPLRPRILSFRQGRSKTHAINSDQMRNVQTFKKRGWDFDDVWTINNEINDGFPHLRKPR
jgi:hypothetical protein